VAPATLVTEAKRAVLVNSTLEAWKCILKKTVVWRLIGEEETNV